jgi:transcriptional regulator with PAS, ATPase and Fis domain
VEPDAPVFDTTEEAILSPSRPERRPRLTLAFQAERPLEPPSTRVLSEAKVHTLRRALVPAPFGTSGSEIAIFDRFVSAPHATLHREQGRFWLRDERSKNGTFVDGRRIETCDLADGARIQIGGSFLVFRASEGAVGEQPFGEFATRCPGYAAHLRELGRVAPTDNAVLLRGETGTGKEVLARAVHRLSGRSGPFQAINCAALAPSVAQSELFGYRKGAFTGAAEDRPGLIRSADGGTLFLDEIGDLTEANQGLFLRVLQERELTPLGATRPIPAKFRLVSATHRALESMVEKGTFRADLFARIRGFTLRLLPLRERPEDVGALIAALLRRHAGARAEEVRFSLAAAKALFLHAWPLNVRELENALATALSLSFDGYLDEEHFPEAITDIPAPPPPPAELTAEEKQKRAELIEVLCRLHGNVAAAARELGVHRTQIYRWIRRYQITREEIFPASV